MSANSTIEWTESTWNPVVGCRKVSPGCDHCYAIRDAHRMAGNPNPKIAAANAGLTVLQNGRLNWTGAVRCLHKRLGIPLAWRKPRRIFVNSQSDLFHEEVPFQFIAQVFGIIALCQRHTFQILTKRPDRMRDFMAGEQLNVMGSRVPVSLAMQEIGFQPTCDWSGEWPPPNAWLGTSVEDRARLWRVDALRETPGAVRYLSLEPLLEDLGTLDLTGIHWVITGGESGSHARPAHPQWFRSIRDQCLAAEVPYFHKQNGAYWALRHGEGGVRSGDLWMLADGRYERVTGAPETWEGALPDVPEGEFLRCVGKKRAGRLLDSVEWNEFPIAPRALP